LGEPSYQSFAGYNGRTDWGVQSVTNFADMGLHSRLITLLEDRQLREPTGVQGKAIPVLMSGKDGLISAETGAGKTLAYLLPIFHKLLGDQVARDHTSPVALVMLPTRELADQVYKECLLFSGKELKPALISGGQEFRYQAALLRRNPEIVIATPGRLLEHCQSKTIDLSEVSILVLDEADRMLDMGFRDDVLGIAGMIESPHQTVLLSATLKHRGISAIAESTLRDPEKILLASPRQVNTNIKLGMLLADDPAHKVRLLLWLLANEPFERALVFVNTRERTENIASELQKHSHRVSYLHGEILQDNRRKIMAGFRQGKSRVLVATDLAARGLDVPELDLVINIDMAHSGEEFIHRAGRTGRAGQAGRVISMVSPPEWNLSAGIQRFLSTTFERLSIKGLEGDYKGPKKLKSSGKAAGKKKKVKAENRKPKGKKPKPQTASRGTPERDRSQPQGFETFKPRKK
jgi:ATP-dependent RNA helicase SrmB